MIPTLSSKLPGDTFLCSRSRELRCCFSHRRICDNASRANISKETRREATYMVRMVCIAISPLACNTHQIKHFFSCTIHKRPSFTITSRRTTHSICRRPLTLCYAMLQTIVATLGILGSVQAQIQATPQTINLQSRVVPRGLYLKRRALSPTTVPLADFFLGTDLQ